MIELDRRFRGRGTMRGCSFTQIASSSFAYIYLVEDDETGDKRYEVFKRKEGKDMDVVIGGVPVHYSAKVLYPTDREFGVSAKCCTTLKRAVYWYDKWNKEK